MDLPLYGWSRRVRNGQYRPREINIHLTTEHCVAVCVDGIKVTIAIIECPIYTIVFSLVTIQIIQTTTSSQGRPLLPIKPTNTMYEPFMDIHDGQRTGLLP